MENTDFLLNLAVIRNNLNKLAENVELEKMDVESPSDEKIQKVLAWENGYIHKIIETMGALTLEYNAIVEENKK